MQMYFSKLFELLDIVKKANKSYLHIRLSFNKTNEFLFEIDEETAASLLAVTSFKEKGKYRLSLNSYWDSTQQKDISYITKTYRDQSERIYFSCTKEYANKIASIKDCQHLTSLFEFPYLFIHNEPLEEPQTKPSQNIMLEETKSERISFRFSWGKIAFISVSVLVLFGFTFSNATNVNTLEKNESAFVNAEIVDKVIPETNEEKEIDSQLDIDSSNQSNLPFIELNNEKTYSLPEGTVALTFDDGPSVYTKEIVNILKEYQVGGTFFYVGTNVNKYPEAVKHAKENGYSIGNHSMTHKQLTKIDFAKQESEIITASQLIAEITMEDTSLFRPPYGSLNETTTAITDTYNNKIVLWNNDPKDWKHRNPDAIFNNIVNTKTSGAIILLHESQAVVDALPRIIEYLQQQNLQIVSLK